MKIAIITQGLSPILEPILSSGHDVVAVIESQPRVPIGALRAFVLRLLCIFGLKSNLKYLCKSKNIMYLAIDKSNQTLIASHLKALEVDLLVVYSMSQLLKKQVLSIPRKGCINLHPAYLPQFRGPNPIFWGYFSGGDCFGATIHYIDEGEDTGDILYQKKVNLPKGMSYFSAQKQIISEGVALLLRAISDIDADKTNPIPQPENSPTLRARNVSAEEYWGLVQWENWMVEQVWHFLRGTDFFLNYNSVKKTIGLNPFFCWNVRDRFVENYQIKARVGSLLKYRGQFCLVCSNGLVFLNKKITLRSLLSGLMEMFRR